jgi:hypothetical protein
MPARKSALSINLARNRNEYPMNVFEMKIDLRSDTITRPTREMQEAMWSAEVGDDVFGDDPTVNALQEKAAKLFGTDDALFLSLRHDDQPTGDSCPHPPRAAT